MDHNSILYFKVMHVQISKNRISVWRNGSIKTAFQGKALAGPALNFPQSFISYDSRFISSEEF